MSEVQTSTPVDRVRVNLTLELPKELLADQDAFNAYCSNPLLQAAIRRAVADKYGE